MTAPFPTATILGYPRIGAHRETKKALEAFWKGSLNREDLDSALAQVQKANLTRLQELGLKEDYAIPASFSHYDQVLDAVRLFTAVPSRFASSLGAEGLLSLEGYFDLARGTAEQPALELTKWFDTNYHYLVPELSETTEFRLNTAGLFAQLDIADEAGVKVRPQVVGPLTFLLLAKAADDAAEGFTPISRLADLLEEYESLLAALAERGFAWLQLDEPALVTDAALAASGLDEAGLAELVTSTYRRLSAVEKRPALLVTSPYGDLGANLPALAESGIEALHVDAVSAHYGSRLAEIFDGAHESRPALVLGAVNGRNIWRADLAAALKALDGAGWIAAIATSTSLQHVPHTLTGEDHLHEGLRNWLAFADEKVAEVLTLARALRNGAASISAEVEAATAALAERERARGVHVPEIRDRVAASTAQDAAFERASAQVRQAAQKSLDLPELPTTTIGSFPQTSEIRKQRAAYRAGAISQAEFEEFLRAEIASVIRLQEEIGLDVLVHGEAERNDMVQYFAENFDGFDTTVNGWVQSYGSRCTRPSILWGDVKRSGAGLAGEAFTVPWISYAASLTEKHVKGMLTGPVTILAWSFVRDDIPRAEAAYQVALALADEIADLEAAGIRIIQVDEPALRELLPLRAADQAAYLDWSVGSFRLATSQVADSTQIHTHLCYSEFNEIFASIDGLNADVTSIEAARSRLELLADLPSSFDRDLGPGVWDIHSPRVPSVEEISELIAAAREGVRQGHLWINPDCGLKTRGYAETRASLENLVAATELARSAQTTGVGV